MDHGKYFHEVLEEATAEDIAEYIALKNTEGQEQVRAQQRAAAKAKAKGM